MNRDEARELLQCIRPEDRANPDPEVAEALALAENDAELREELENTLAFDEKVYAAMASIPVPAGLKDRILQAAANEAEPEAAGRTISSARTPLAGSSRPASAKAEGKTFGFGFGLGLALSFGAVALIAVAIALLRPYLPGGKDSPQQAEGEMEDWQLHAFASLNRMQPSDLDLGGPGKEVSRAELTNWLKSHELPVPEKLMAGLTEEKLVGCLNFKDWDEPMSQICFYSLGGRLLHLIVVDNGQPEMVKQPRMGVHGKWKAATWAENGRSYMLVTEIDNRKESEEECLNHYLPRA